MMTAVRILDTVPYDPKSVFIEQCPVFQAIKARMVERLAFVGADRLAVCRPLVNIRAASGAACFLKMGNMPRCISGVR